MTDHAELLLTARELDSRVKVESLSGRPERMHADPA